MVHKFPDRADEQSKEAELVRLRTPPRKIWIDLMTGQICDPEPIEHGGQVIPFTAPSNRLRRNNKSKDKQMAERLRPGSPVSRRIGLAGLPTVTEDSLQDLQARGWLEGIEQAWTLLNKQGDRHAPRLSARSHRS